MLLPCGKLWYDDDKSTLEEKIARGLRYYADRQGLIFDTVYVHSSMVLTGGKICGIQVVVNDRVMRDHFWFCNLENGEQAVGAQPAVTNPGG